MSAAPLRYTCPACDQCVSTIGGLLRKDCFFKSPTLAVCSPCAARINADAEFNDQVMSRYMKRALKLQFEALAKQLLVSPDDFEAAFFKQGPDDQHPFDTIALALDRTQAQIRAAYLAVARASA